MLPLCYVQYLRLSYFQVYSVYVHVIRARPMCYKCAMRNLYLFLYPLVKTAIVYVHLYNLPRPIMIFSIIKTNLISDKSRSESVKQTRRQQSPLRTLLFFADLILSEAISVDDVAVASAASAIAARRSAPRRVLGFRSQRCGQIDRALHAFELVRVPIDLT